MLRCQFYLHLGRQLCRIIQWFFTRIDLVSDKAPRSAYPPNLHYFLQFQNFYNLSFLHWWRQQHSSQPDKQETMILGNENFWQASLSPMSSYDTLGEWKQPLTDDWTHISHRTIKRMGHPNRTIDRWQCGGPAFGLC